MSWAFVNLKLIPHSLAVAHISQYLMFSLSLPPSKLAAKMALSCGSSRIRILVGAFPNFTRTPLVFCTLWKVLRSFLCSTSWIARDILLRNPWAFTYFSTVLRVPLLKGLDICSFKTFTSERSEDICLKVGSSQSTTRKQSLKAASVAPQVSPSVTNPSNQSKKSTISIFRTTTVHFKNPALALVSHFPISSVFS